MFSLTLVPMGLWFFGIANQVSNSANPGKTPSRRVMASGARRRSALRVHPLLEVGPPLLRNADFAGRDLRRALGEDVQEDQQPIRPPVENAIEPPPVVAPKLTQLAFDLGAVRERQVRHLVGEQVQTIDLVVDRGLLVLVERVDELANRLDPVWIAVVDGLEVAHGDSNARPAAGQHHVRSPRARPGRQRPASAYAARARPSASPSELATSPQDAPWATADRARRPAIASSSSIDARTSTKATTACSRGSASGAISPTTRAERRASSERTSLPRYADIEVPRTSAAC